jgi:cell division septation protein DedD
MHILQAAVALALLIGFPVILETPTSREGTLAAAIGALVLVALAVQGVVRFVRSRKPRSYADSVMLPPKPGDHKPPTSTKED